MIVAAVLFIPSTEYICGLSFGICLFSLCQYKEIRFHLHFGNVHLATVVCICCERSVVDISVCDLWY